jgi:excisionase family DNA binding protein
MTERFLTSRELADQLGFTTSTIQNWYEAGKLPGLKLGGRLRFRLSEVEAWLERQRKDSLTPAPSPTTVSIVKQT